MAQVGSETSAARAYFDLVSTDALLDTGFVKPSQAHGDVLLKKEFLMSWCSVSRYGTHSSSPLFVDRGTTAKVWIVTSLALM